MQKKQLTFNIQGMAQDVLKPEVNNKFAYRIWNMRLTATKDSQLLSLSTEKGTTQLNTAECLKIGDNQFTPIISPLVGTFLGACILQDNLILFTKNSDQGDLNPDYIYKLFFFDYGNGNEDIINNRISYKLLYRGNLNFSLEHPIEAIASYETELSQKVYWIDSLNQPRVINITQDYIHADVNYNAVQVTSDPFSFTQEINLTDTNSISVEKQFYGGLFNAGVVQYAYCYYRLNAQESNIVNFTPIYYVSFSDRGEEPGKQVSCSFKITIQSNSGDIGSFDYVRVYQIYSSSLQGTPNVKIIKDIDISVFTEDNNYTYSFIDNNEFQVDATEYDLQMIKQFIVPQTITSKDNVLFFGNYKSNFVVDKTDLSRLQTKPQFTRNGNRTLVIDDGSDTANVYKYKNQLDKSSQDIKTFKYGEHYKFGVQFQNKYGQWSEPYFLGNVTNNIHISGYDYNSGTCQLPYAYLNTSEIYNAIMQQGSTEEQEYIRIRPVVSFPTQNERLVLCQGVLNPTVFNITDRVNGSTYAQASWFFRPYPNVDWDGNTSYKDDNSDPANDQPATQWYEMGATCQFKHLNPLMSSDNIGCELQNMYFDSVSDISNISFSDMLTGTVNSMYVRQSVKTYLGNYFSSNSAFNSYAFNNGWNIGYIYQIDFQVPGSDGVWTLRIKVLERAGSYIKYRMTIFAPVSIVMHIREEGGTVNDNQLAKRPQLTAADLGSKPNAGAIYQNYYYVDQSTVTLNSPDVEFDTGIQNADLSQYNVRVVGYIPLLSNSGNYQIIASTPLFKMNQLYPDDEYRRGTQLPTGHYKKVWQLHGRWNLSSGHGMLCAQNCWFDDINGVFLWEGINHTGWNRYSQEVSYYVYPWQREYLNNYNHNTLDSGGAVNSNYSIEDIESSKITRKILANIKFSENTQYFNMGNLYSLPTSLDALKLFTADQDITLKLEPDKFYKANIDKLIATSSLYYSMRFSGQAVSGDDPQFIEGDVQGYPIVVGSAGYNENSDTNIDAAVTYSEPRLMSNGKGGYYYTPNCSSIDPITMRYKSTPHIVFSLSESGRVQNILPIGSYQDEVPGFAWDPTVDWSSGEKFIWDDRSSGPSGTCITSVNQDVLAINTRRGYLWIGEVYRNLKEGETTTFDNDDNFSLQQRDWVVAGETVDFSSSAVLRWYEGDTFYQRYDCLKTAPFSKEDYQSVVEILSFMCETRINLDGRYDRNRGLLDNTLVDDTNFNQLNPVYGQENNFFTYHILDEDLFNANEFPNQITWTLPKVSGAKVDNWTNITLAATIDADGSRGEISALRKFRDEMYCFQTGGIGRLLYNERVQISTSDGTPIEIGNSNRMQGIKYVSNIVGCQNKWACKETPSGIFFVDNNTPGIYTLADEGQITNISKQKYMQKWFENCNTIYHGIWNIQYPTNCILLYDAAVDEVLMSDLTSAMAYSNQLGFFTSIYYYRDMPELLTLEKYPLGISSDCTIHRLRNGAYSSFFGVFEPFGLTLLAYPFSGEQFVRDCIYENVWYKGDGFTTGEIYLPDEHFDYIVASNEYQQSSPSNGDLVYENTSNHTNTSLRKKFRLWYARIPRDARAGNKHSDKMRNPWLYLTLCKIHPRGNTIRLQELMVDCYY